MKNGWPIEPLGKVCENLDSKRVPITKSKRAAGKYPYYGASGVVDHVADYLFDEELLLVSEDGANLLARTYPIAFSVTGKVWVNNHAHVLRFADITSQRFMEFYLGSISLDPYVSGMAQPKLNQKSLNSIPVPNPPLPDQRRIVGILDEAFDGIATAKAAAEKNLQNARELFESYLNGVFTQRGEGWEETNLGSEIDLLTGFPFKSSQYTSSNKSVRLLRGDNIIQGSLRWDNAKKWPISDSAEYDRYQLCVGDVVLAMDRPWIKAGLKRAQITFDDLPCLLVQRTARLRGNKNLDNRFLVYLISSTSFAGHILGVQTGIGVPHVSGKQIKDFQFLKPPMDEQANIAEQLDKLTAETQRLESIYQRKLAALDELKKSLLHQAFSGRL